MEKEKDYRIKVGEDGERFVKQILDNVLKQMDYDYRIMQNAFLPFKSVYGKRGYITAEFDFIIFTPFYIYIIEVKNESYFQSNLFNGLWTLEDGKKVSNPLKQNNMHKLVFCSEMGVSRENVITIEIILGRWEHSEESTPFVNDYVFGKEGLYSNIFYLLASESEEKLDYQKLYMIFSNKSNQITKVEHLNNLDYVKKIERRIENVMKHLTLSRTDIIKCDYCKLGNLIFREALYKDEPSCKKRSTHFALGCSNYGNDKINCNAGLIYVDKNKNKEPFKKLKAIHIEEQNGWGKEKVNKTILDRINALEEKNKELNERIIDLNYELGRAKNQLGEKENKNEKLNEEIKEYSSMYNNAKKELGKFRKIIGRIYIFSK